MTFPGLVGLVARDPHVASALDEARLGGARALDFASAAPLRPLLAAALATSGDRPLLVVTPTYREAEYCSEALGSLLGADEVAYYPAWETLPHERLSPRSDIVGRRLAVLRRLAGVSELPAPRVLVAPVRSLLQPQVKALASLLPVRIETGAEYDLGQLASDLVQAAYTRVDLVERRGEFAVRGGILDVFPPTLEHPVRVDFFGDEVEEIRSFSVADQRSTGEAHPAIVASPCRELLITDDVRRRAGALVDAHPELSDILERIAAGHAVDGMEALAPALVDGMELLIDVLPAETTVVVSDPELVRGRAAELVRTSDEFLKASWAAAAAGGQAPIDLGASSYRALGDVRRDALARGMLWWSMSPFAADVDGERVPVYSEDGELIDLSAIDASGVDSHILATSPLPVFNGEADDAVDKVRAVLADGWRVVLSAEGRGPAQRFSELMAENGIPARVETTIDAEPEPDVVHVVVTELRHGVRLDSVKLQVLTTRDMFGSHAVDKADRRMPTRRKKTVDPLELASGDLVVHEHHGVGRYVEMAQRTIGGATRDYLVLEYAASRRGQAGDRVYVPMDQMDLVTRYVGGEAPALDRLGGNDWAKRKGRARRAVRQIAAQLIKLYAARQASRGFAFGPDTPWQRELEDAFGYVETPDQLACMDEVKRDMENQVPMDRLICGDVGYGKTEIAVRAAFKAVQDAKQVAVLVPTTLLVQQHYQTFADRYSGFPVTVAALSRFQTDAEAKKVIDGLAAGTVDVVIGTHRLLSDAITFRDLGLVIIDEEQRFGVEHKEKLKQLRLNVDVLAMSATPIPRTLEMAITGIREMSVIATPPEERHPVLTFAGAYDEGQVTAAIRRELAREGQAFFVHNRVQSIEKVARRLRELVPEARVITAHGQMTDSALEKVMIDFWERRADVLVSTTIVEAGLDIQSANTLLIDRADNMGLSQLHQLRGRVGRGRERAYAYFLYPPEKALTQTAHDRLATMAANADLGAGMKIAMKDLEIRGAGNLLGGEQSGHIADVGFDLYIRLVGEAVAEFRSDGSTEPEPEMRIELPVEANLPVDYIESERLRLEMYKRLAEVRTADDLEAVRSELVDRYGEPTPEVESLLAVAAFRMLARAHGLTEVVAQGTFIRFAPIELPDSKRLRLQRLYPGAVLKPGLMLIPRPKTAPVAGELLQDQALLGWASDVVTSLLEPVAGQPTAVGSAAGSSAAGEA